jgi:pimeloyl-ACP methyl ester carboxylesterase
MWSPLLDLTPEELGALVQEIAALPSGTPYLSLHGLDGGPGYAAWLTALIPGATVEVWDEVPTHYPHLVDPARFVTRVREFTA